MPSISLGERVRYINKRIDSIIKERINESSILIRSIPSSFHQKIVRTTIWLKERFYIYMYIINKVLIFIILYIYIFIIQYTLQAKCVTVKVTKYGHVWRSFWGGSKYKYFLGRILELLCSCWVMMLIAKWTQQFISTFSVSWHFWKKKKSSICRPWVATVRLQMPIWLYNTIINKDEDFDLLRWSKAFLDYIDE